MQQWSDLNNMQLIFFWLQISVRLDWIFTDQIQLCSSFNPSSGFAQSPLIQVIDFASLLHFLSHSHLILFSYFTFSHFTIWISLYIYLSDYHVGSNNLENNHYNCRLNCKFLTNPFTGRPSTVNSVQKLIPVLTAWARLIQRIPWNPSVAEWTR